jgi:hypothetical protein
LRRCCHVGGARPALGVSFYREWARSGFAPIRRVKRPLLDRFDAAPSRPRKTAGRRDHPLILRPSLPIHRLPWRSPFRPGSHGRRDDAGDDHPQWRFAPPPVGV